MTILLDTNVVSELWRPVSALQVQVWMDAQMVETLYLAAIAVAKLRYSIAVLPDGNKKRELRQRLERQLLLRFEGRVCRSMKLRQTSTGRRAISGKAVAQARPDILHAATALANSMAVATRDTAPFLASGVEVIDSWKG